jgi:hypothetical protein
MASIIRIKRSSTSGNPSTLGAGELAYSALADNGSNGGDRLYIGMGTETAGNAVNHVVIGGKFFTDRLSQTAGVLTANAAIVVDVDKKIDNLKVDNLDLNGNTISTTNLNGDLLITPNGNGKTIVTNLYVDASTSLLEYIQDATGGQLSSTTGSLDISYNDSTGTTNIDLNTEYAQDLVGAMFSGVETDVIAAYNDTTAAIDITLKTVNSNVGSFGGTTKIPTFTVNAKGLVTAAGEVDVATNLSLAGDTGTDTVSLLTDTLTFTGGEGIDTVVSNNNITISAELATSSNAGVASFNTSGFVVTAGDVVLKTNVVQGLTTDTGALTVTGNAISILGGEGMDVTHSGTTITVAGEDATASNKGVASFDSGDFTVTAGAVSIKNAGVSNAQLENSVVTIGSTAINLGGTSTSLAGVTQLTVDNIDINGNTISSTDTNGNIVLSPNGTGTVDVADSRITGVAAPVASTDAANKAYVDSAVTGLDWKNAVNLMAISNVALTGSTNTLVIDGHSALDSTDSNVYRLLLVGQTTSSENGIYSYTDNGTTYALVRSTDADTYQELLGTSVYVMEGVQYGKTGWVQTNHYITSFSGQSWVQFSGSGAYVAGNGLTLTGTTFDVIGTANRIDVSANSIDISSNYIGQNTITTLGTVTTGTWNATIIAGQYGGTGVNNAGKTITLGGNLVTSGAYATTLVSTGTTSVTLPTTGTLATLAGSEALSNKTITASSFSGTTLAASGLVTFTNTTDAGPLGTAAVVMSGGLSVAKQMFVGTHITGSGASTSNIDGFNIDGGTY